MRKLSQTPRAIAERKRRAAQRAEDYRAAWQARKAHLDAHMVVRADGSEVVKGDEVAPGSGVIFQALTRAPGDGTGTNGKISVRDPHWGMSDGYREVYPSNYGLKVVPRG